MSIFGAIILTFSICFAIFVSIIFIYFENSVSYSKYEKHLEEIGHLKKEVNYLNSVISRQKEDIINLHSKVLLNKKKVKK